MDALSAEPIERFALALDHFLFAPEVRLLYAAVDPGLRCDVLEVAAACETEHPVATLVAILETAADDSDAQWSDRADELRRSYDEMRRLVADEPDGLPLPALPPVPKDVRGLRRFVHELALVCRAVPDACELVTVVLAPLERDPKARRWETDLRTLVAASSAAPELARARFVVVDPDGPVSETLVRALGESAEGVDARIPDAAAQEALGGLLAALQRVPEGSRGARASGAAGPAVRPPPRPGELAPLSPAQTAQKAAQQGVRPELLDSDWTRRLAILELGANQAAARGEHERACTLQREAANMIAKTGDERRAVGAELALVAYALSGGATAAAEHALAAARARAAWAQLVDELIAADLVRASLLMRTGQPTKAAELYGQIARSVEHDPGKALFAIELFRLCGATLEPHALYASTARAAYERAVELARRIPPLDRLGSSAPVAARALAAMLRRAGDIAAAQRYDAIADELDAPPPELTTTSTAEA